METKRAYKSFRYQNRVLWQEKRRGKISAPGKPEIEVGSPPEFRGEPGVWSPEELLVASLNTCLMLTFMSMAQAKKLEFLAYESAADGVLENLDGKYRITEVTVTPSLTLKSDADVETARTLMAGVEEHCFISNSIRAKVTLVPQFRVGGGTAG
jgi:organic hydroperoxide reductase OsmC/OhrA